MLGRTRADKFRPVPEALVGENIFGKPGMPTALLQDGDADLAKAARLLRNSNKDVFVIPDIGHVFANMLKKQYAHSTSFETLLSLANRFRSLVLQNDLSNFRPAKLRTKERFHSLSKLINLAKNMQVLCCGRGRAKTGSLKQKLRVLFPDLHKVSSFLNTFSRECKCLNEVQKLLKEVGFGLSPFSLKNKRIGSFGQAELECRNGSFVVTQSSCN
jgi:hypothetical protein